MTEVSAPQGAKKRGFAAMDPELQREISRKGGSSVPDKKRLFSKNPDFARECAVKGGRKSGAVRKEKAAAEARTNSTSVLAGLSLPQEF